MKVAPRPSDELERLSELRNLNILDSEAEASFDEITQIASAICDCKIALISLVDEGRQWFKSKFGLEAQETPRDVSFCGHAICQDDIFIVEDAEFDERFCDNPLFLNEPHVRFYAGVPLVTPRGFRIGTLCVIDPDKKVLEESQIKTLKSLAKHVVQLIELRYKNSELLKTSSLMKTKESDLEKVVNEFNQFFHLNLNYLVIAGLDGKFKKFNKAWYNLGYTEQELLNTPFIEFVHEQDRVATIRELEQLSQGRETINFENRYLRKDGSYIDLKWTTSPDTQNGLVYAVAVDITESKKKAQIEREISQLRAQYIDYSLDRKKFFNYLLDKLLILTDSEYGFIGEVLEDEKGKFLKSYVITDISWNEETKKFYDDFSADGLVFRNLNTLFGEVIQTGDLLMANDAPHHPKASGIPKGHPALNKFFGIPIYSRNQFIAMVGLANRSGDYTIELYEELRPYLDLVGEMLRAITVEAELEQQKRLAMHNSRLAMIGQLAAGVGHEINNPLQILMGHLTLSRHQLEKSMTQEDQIFSRIDKMQVALNRILNIVTGLRAFARSDEVEISSFNLCELVKETVDMIHDIYRKDEVEVNYDCPQRGEIIEGNRGRIQQVLMNLLANAKDATEGKSNRKIKIQVVPDGEFIKLEVKDNGSGIPKEIGEKIFEPFFTTKDVNKGTGIGLALASTIIREHGGKLSFESEKDRGTKFFVCLPFKR